MDLSQKEGWLSHLAFWGACALVIGIFSLGVQPSFYQLSHPDPADSYYNRLVRGFQSGQLNIKMDAPPELARLSDPYDPAINKPYIGDNWDMVYYRGKLYLYFGIAPALTLLWPFAALTGHYLSDPEAVVIFSSAGFLAAAGILYSVRRRYFPEASVWALAAGIVLFGAVVDELEVISPWYDVYEVAGSSGFAFTMFSVGALWRALTDTKHAVRWLFLASLAYGLAIASRPTMLFGAIILLTPAIRKWSLAAGFNKWKQAGPLLMAAVIPLTSIGLGLMLYNFLRFRNPFEFGLHYQLQGYYDPQTARQFSPRFLWFNLCFYLFGPMRLAGHFPFFRAFQDTSFPIGYQAATGNTYGGIMIISPAIWLALAALFFCRRELKDDGLRWFIKALLLLFVICAITTSLFFIANSRYGLDFIPALMLLAAIGIFWLEKVAATAGHRIARRIWPALVSASLVLVLLVGIEAHAEANYFAGNFLVQCGRQVEAVPCLQKALAVEPRSANFHTGLGTAYFRQGRLDDAIVEYKRAFECESNFPEAVAARNNLGHCLLEKGRVDEAIVQFEEALKLEPQFAEVHNILGDCFFQQGRMNEAMAEYENAVKINPDDAEAQNNFGYSLLLAGRAKEAMIHFQTASKIAPNNPDFHNNLGSCLLQMGLLDDAISQFRRAIELRPNLAQAYHNLAEAFRRKGMQAEAKASDQMAAKLNARSETGK